MVENEMFWCQLSMWEFSPDNCIEAYTRSNENTFHYVLLQAYNVIDNRYKTRYITDHNSVPLKLLLKDKSDLFLRVNGKREILHKENNK